MSNGKRRGLPGRVKMRHDQHFVEELTQRSLEEPVGQMLALDSIAPDPNQPRNAMGELEELAGSIRDKGVLEPILVRPQNGDNGESYRIISGERRFHAAKKAGLHEVPAIVMEVSEEEALEIALIENLQRKDLTPFEEAEGYRALGENHGYTHEEISRAVGKARSSVTEALQLLKMEQPIRNAAEALGVHSKSILLTVHKAQASIDEKIGMLEKIAGGELNREDLRELRKTGKGRKPKRQPAKKAAQPTFTFAGPDKTFSLSVRFRRDTVDRDDLISALETILQELRQENS